MTRARVYGIDFGTSNSALRIGRDDGTFVWVKDPGATHAASSVPTAVSLLPSGELIVGHTARRARGTRPRHYRAEFKQYVGEETPLLLGDRGYLAHELASRVLGFLRELALATVDGEPERVAIAVPAAWERTKRELLEDAALVAGFSPDQLQLVDEPVAAAAAAFADAGASGAETLLVYDLGGGTFDCAVARAGVHGMEVLGAPGGLPDVGGRAFDQEISAELARRFPEQYAELAGGDRSDVDVLRRLLTLRGDCEDIKLDLSVNPAPQPFLLSALRPAVETQFTRDELDALLAPMLEETVMMCETVLAAVRRDWRTVDRIVPVGGSVRMPAVGQLLHRRSGRGVLRVADPELAVAHGAALIAEREVRLPGVVGDVPRRPRREPGARRGVTHTLTHVDGVRSLAFDVRTGMLGATSGGGTRLWSADLAVRLDIPGERFGIAFDPAHPRVALSMPTGGVAVHRLDPPGPDPRPEILCGDVGDPLWGLAFSPAGTYLAAAGRSSRIANLRGTPDPPAPWQRFGGEFRTVAWSADGRFVAAGDVDGVLCLSTLSVGTESIRGHTAAVRQVVLDPDGTRLVSASASGTVLVHRIGAGETPLVITPGGRLTSVALSVDGKLLATADSTRGAVELRDATTGEQRGQFVLGAPATTVGFSPDGRFLAAGAMDGAVRLIDLAAL